jgi:ankyrin repeat protein
VSSERPRLLGSSYGSAKLVEGGHEKAVMLLLDHKANVNMSKEDGITPLMQDLF